jgi:hypothetical protein
MVVRSDSERDRWWCEQWVDNELMEALRKSGLGAWEPHQEPAMQVARLEAQKAALVEANQHLQNSLNQAIDNWITRWQMLYPSVSPPGVLMVPSDCPELMFDLQMWASMADQERSRIATYCVFAKRFDTVKTSGWKLRARRLRQLGNKGGALLDSEIAFYTIKLQSGR